MILFDIKLLDPELHIKYTGVSNSSILENLRYLSGSGTELEIRIPIIPGITDTVANIRAAKDFLRSLSRAPAVRILAHHPAAMSKYGRFGLEQKLADIAPPTDGRMSAIAAELREAGLDVIT